MNGAIEFPETGADAPVVPPVPGPEVSGPVPQEETVRPVPARTEAGPPAAEQVPDPAPPAPERCGSRCWSF